MSPSGFTKSVLDVWPVWVPQRLCPSASFSLSVFVLCSLAEVNLRTICWRLLLLITTPCQQPDLASSTTVVNRLSFGDSGLTLFKGSAQGWESPESYSGVWECWFIPPLLLLAYLTPIFFMGRILSGMSE